MLVLYVFTFLMYLAINFVWLSWSNISVQLLFFYWVIISGYLASQYLKKVILANKCESVWISPGRVNNLIVSLWRFKFTVLKLELFKPMSYHSDQFTEITSVSSVKCSKNTSEGERKESSMTALLKCLTLSV